MGQSFNPHTSTNEPVSGVRKLVIRDRGVGRKVRYLMRLKRDELQEGTLSYRKVKGKLPKTK